MLIPNSVADPGCGAFFTLDPDPESGIGFFPDLGSQTVYPINLSSQIYGLYLGSEIRDPGKKTPDP
jgi:hypothetical protein